MYRNKIIRKIILFAVFQNFFSEKWLLDNYYMLRFLCYELCNTILKVYRLEGGGYVSFERQWKSHIYILKFKDYPSFWSAIFTFFHKFIWKIRLRIAILSSIWILPLNSQRSVKISNYFCFQTQRIVDQAWKPQLSELRQIIYFK